MPDWPARLSEDLAALYLGISQNTLRAGVGSGRYPQPIREGGRLLYARVMLDRFVMAQAGLREPTNDGEGQGWAA